MKNLTKKILASILTSCLLGFGLAGIYTVTDTYNPKKANAAFGPAEATPSGVHLYSAIEYPELQVKVSSGFYAAWSWNGAEAGALLPGSHFRVAGLIRLNDTLVGTMKNISTSFISNSFSPSCASANFLLQAGIDFSYADTSVPDGWWIPCDFAVPTKAGTYDITQRWYIETDYAQFPPGQLKPHFGAGNPVESTLWFTVVPAPISLATSDFAFGVASGGTVVPASQASQGSILSYSFTGRDAYENVRSGDSISAVSCDGTGLTPNVAGKTISISDSATLGPRTCTFTVSAGGTYTRTITVTEKDKVAIYNVTPTNTYDLRATGAAPTYTLRGLHFQPNSAVSLAAGTTTTTLASNQYSYDVDTTAIRIFDMPKLTAGTYTLTVTTPNLGTGKYDFVFQSLADGPADLYKSALTYSSYLGDLVTTGTAYDVRTGSIKVSPKWVDSNGYNATSKGTLDVQSCWGTAEPGWTPSAGNLDGTITFGHIGEAQCQFKLNLNGALRIFESPVWTVSNLSTTFSLYNGGSFDLRNLPAHAFPNAPESFNGSSSLVISGVNVYRIEKLTIGGKEIYPGNYTVLDNQITIDPMPDFEVGSELRSTAITAETAEDKQVVVTTPLGTATTTVGYYLTPPGATDMDKSYITFDKTNRGTSLTGDFFQLGKGSIKVQTNWVDERGWPTTTGTGTLLLKGCTTGGSPSFNATTNVISFGAIGSGTCSFRLAKDGNEKMYSEREVSFDVADFSDVFALDKVAPDVVNLRYPSTTITIKGKGFTNGGMDLFIGGRMVDGDKWQRINTQTILVYGVPDYLVAADEPYSVLLQSSLGIVHGELTVWYQESEAVSMGNSKVEYQVHTGAGISGEDGGVIDVTDGYVDIVPEWLDKNGWPALSQTHGETRVLSYQIISGSDTMIHSAVQSSPSGSIRLRFTEKGNICIKARLTHDAGNLVYSYWPDNAQGECFMVGDLKNDFRITSVSPERFDVRAPDTTMTIHGAGFSTDVKVYLAGTLVPPAAVQVNQGVITISPVPIPNLAEAYDPPQKHTMVVQSGAVYVDSLDYEFFYTPTGPTSVLHSTLSYVPHKSKTVLATESDPYIDQATGFVEVIPQWKDVNEYVTTISTGSLAQSSCEGSASPQLETAGSGSAKTYTMKFGSTGTGKCVLSLVDANQVSFSFTSPTYTVLDEYFELAITSVTPKVVNTSQLDSTTLTFVGSGFDAPEIPRVIIGGTIIGQGAITALNNSVMHIHGLPNKAAGVYQISLQMGSQVVADHTITYVASGSALPAQTTLDYKSHLGTGITTGSIIDQQTGYVTVTPTWRDINGFSTSTGTGAVAQEKCVGTAQPRYADGTISFDSIGTGSCELRITIPGVGIDFRTTPEFQVGNLSQQFRIDSISPATIDKRAISTSVTLLGAGFLGASVFIDNSELATTAFSVISSTKIVISQLPDLAVGPHTVAVQVTGLGIATKNIDYYFIEAGPALAEVSEFTYTKHYGSGATGTVFDLATGFVEVGAIWKDANGYKTDINNGVIVGVSCEGTAQPRYADGSITFRSVGTGSCLLKLLVPRTFDDESAEYFEQTAVFKVAKLSEPFALTGISPSTFDLRQPATTVTLTGTSLTPFGGVEVYVDNEKIGTSDLELSATQIIIKKMPVLPSGWHVVSVHTAVGDIASKQIEYFYVEASNAALVQSTVGFTVAGGSDTLLDMATGSVSAYPIWKDANGLDTSVAVGVLQSCSVAGSAGTKLDYNVITFVSPGTAVLTCVLTLQGTTKAVSSPTYTVTVAEDPLTLTSIEPSRFDVNDTSARTVVVYGSGFMAPLHFYFDDQEVYTPSISIYPAGDAILNIEMPEAAVGFHTVKISTPKGTVTTEVEYYDSKADQTETVEVEGVQYLITDVAGLSASRKTAIGWLAKQEITVGCQTLAQAENLVTIKYCPKNPVNRGAMAEFLYKTDVSVKKKERELTPPEVAPYVDVQKLVVNRVASIGWLKTQSITKGCDTKQTKYCPSNAVNRGAMAEFLFKLAGASATYSDYTPNFKDINGLTRERIRAINWMGTTGITKGFDSKDKYGPSYPVNRGSMAEFLQRYYSYLKK